MSGCRGFSQIVVRAYFHIIYFAEFKFERTFFAPIYEVSEWYISDVTNSSKLAGGVVYVDLKP